MKIRVAITTLITIVMAVTAMAVTSSSRGNSQVVNTFLYNVPAFGFVPGQTVRFSAANLSTEEEGSQPVRVQASVYDSFGNLLSQTDPVQLRAGHLQAFDVKRDDLSAVGEPNTARLQMRAVLRVVFSDGSERYLPEQFSVSMEIMDSRTGGTVVNIGGDYFTGTVTVSGD